MTSGFTGPYGENNPNAILLSLGINPSNNKPYIHSPKEHYEKERHFLDQWYHDLSPERKQLWKEIENSRDNVVSSGFTDDGGKDYLVDEQGYIKPVSNEVFLKSDKLLPITNLIESDPVESPKHYNHGSIEAIVYLKDNLSPEGFIGYCEGNVKKYLHRWRYKSKPLEDLKKAQWYLNKLIEAMEGK